MSAEHVQHLFQKRMEHYPFVVVIVKLLRQLVQKQPTSLCYCKGRYKSTIIYTNTNIQWTIHPKKKTITVVPIKASMLLLTITQETSLLVTFCDAAAAVIISMLRLMRNDTILIGNPYQSSVYSLTTTFAAATAYNHFDHLGQLYKLKIRMVKSTNCFCVLEQFRHYSLYQYYKQLQI